jgi:hypothetical protein
MRLSISGIRGFVGLTLACVISRRFLARAIIPQYGGPAVRALHIGKTGWNSFSILLVAAAVIFK